MSVAINYRTENLGAQQMFIHATDSARETSLANQMSGVVECDQPGGYTSARQSYIAPGGIPVAVSTHYREIHESLPDGELCPAALKSSTAENGFQHVHAHRCVAGS